MVLRISSSSPGVRHISASTTIFWDVPRKQCRSEVAVSDPAKKAKDDFIWAALFHMGTNMWCDQVPDRWGPYKGEDLKLICAADHLRFDEKVWRSLTSRMVEVGMNMVIIDLGEAIQYPSHPELAVKGSWSVERLRAELARLRGMGFEVIPKMNFSACHDTWLKDYHRMVSTQKYYQVCEDLIKDVAEIFDRPRFFHLGFDEETAHHQDNSRWSFYICLPGPVSGSTAPCTAAAGSVPSTTP